MKTTNLNISDFKTDYQKLVVQYGTEALREYKNILITHIKLHYSHMIPEVLHVLKYSFHITLKEEEIK